MAKSLSERGKLFLIHSTYMARQTKGNITNVVYKAISQLGKLTNNCDLLTR